MTAAPRFAMVAGEVSGDLLASLLLSGLKQRWPDVQAFGMGGPAMQRLGFDAWWSSDELAIMGYAEALPRLIPLLRIRRQLGDRILRERPDAFIGIDAPDFNFGLEARLKREGVKAIHFVSPSIWAWRAERIHSIKRSVDHVLCLFPFEPAIYAAEGVPATYVGHPLADAIPQNVSKADARTALGLTLDERASLVALLPGSRRSEIKHIAPTLFDAAALMHRSRPELRFVMPVVPGMRARVDAALQAHAGLPLTLVEGRSHDVLAACDLALVASGTATLEAALFKRPMVAVYRVGWMAERMMKGRNALPWVALPNILLRDFAVPELIQHEATPERVSQEALKWLDDPTRCANVARRFDALHAQLRRNTAVAATDAIANIIQKT